MDFIGSKCPVCDKYFHADEDVVVCPECGTPHHRECYEAIGHCKFEDRHAEGYTYAGDDAPKGDVIVCRSCGKENDKNAFFCQYCAAPLSREDEHQPNRGAAGQPGAGGMPFGANASMFMDPLGGIPADTDMGEGVTAGEMAKYVKQNTPYFMRVFNSIKEFNRSKFNFCAALFTGGYLLYRKMYKIGAVITAIQVGLMILSIYVQIRYASEFKSLNERASSSGSITQVLDYFSTISGGHRFVLYIPTIVSILSLALRITIGCTANRMYYSHCKFQITRIKNTPSPSGESPENALQTRGGVNMPLAVSLLVTYLVISYLPGIISNL